MGKFGAVKRMNDPILGGWTLQETLEKRELKKKMAEKKRKRVSECISFNKEEMGDLLHFAWAKIMKDLFATKKLRENAKTMMGYGYRWKEQMNTEYKDLSREDQLKDIKVFDEWTESRQ